MAPVSDFRMSTTIPGSFGPTNRTIFSSACMPCPVDPALSCKYPLSHKAYFSYYFFNCMPCPVDPGSLSYKHLGPQTLFFIPLFWLVPLTQLYSHANVLRAHKSYFSYQLFEHIPRPVHPASLLCKCSLVHKPYFLYQLFECIPRFFDSGLFSYKYFLAHKPYLSYQLFKWMSCPINPSLFPYKRPLNSYHPVYYTFLIWSYFIYWTQLIALCPFCSTHATLIKFYSYKPNELPSSRSIPSKLFHPTFWIMYCYSLISNLILYHDLHFT